MKRYKADIILILITGLLLAGCSSAAYRNDPEILKTPTGTSEHTDAISGTGEQHLVFMTNRTDKVQNTLAELVSKYTLQHPEIIVDVVGMQDVDYDVKIRMASGELADITPIPGAMNSRNYHLYLEPLNRASFSPDNLMFLESGVGVDGNLYAVNSSMTYYGIVYNKKAFAVAGIEQVPRTRWEFMEACRKLKERRIIPLATVYKDEWPLGIFTSDIFTVSNTGLVDYMQSKSYDDILMEDDGGLLDAFCFMREMYQKGFIENSLSYATWNRTKIEHAQGNIAMLMIGSWYIAQLVDNGAKEEDVGMFPFPDSKAIVYGGDWPFGVSRWSKNKEAAKSFLQWLWEDGRYAKAVGVIPPFKNASGTFPAIEELFSFGLPKVQPVYGPSLSFMDMAEEAQIPLVEELKKYMVSGNPQGVVDEMNNKWVKYRRTQR